MKCFRTPKEFAQAVCLEKGKLRPRNTHYLVQDLQQHVTSQKKAPKSYRGLKQVIFSVDGERFATRRFGVWVDEADWSDEEWLKQRQLRQAVEGLRQRDLSTPFLMAPRSVDPAVETELNKYLNTARWNLYEEFNRKVIEEARRLMEKDGCFYNLNHQGDPLNQAVA
jgi:hypothetical protein